MMHVACIADGHYWRHAGAMVHSLLTRNPGATVHVLHRPDAPREDRERLAQVVGEFGATLNFLPVRDTHDARSHSPYFPDAVWYRIFLPELLPGLDKVLYLDSDIVVLQSLDALWHTDVSGHALGAVTNPMPAIHRNYPTDVLGLAPEDYFNSGVLLLNLQRLRQQHAREDLLAYAAQHPANACPDQDALNALFHDSRLRLHLRWNYQTALLDLRPCEIPIPAAEVGEAAADPAIVHFSGPFKPWMYLCRDPWREHFLHHARRTPWPPQRPSGRTPLSMVLRRLPNRWIWRYFQARARLHNRPW
jgi:lipopolysaccharide biosynthesis glycosyltransferase